MSKILNFTHALINYHECEKLVPVSRGRKRSDLTKKKALKSEEISAKIINSGMDLEIAEFEGWMKMLEKIEMR